MHAVCPVHGKGCTWDCDPAEWSLVQPEQAPRAPRSRGRTLLEVFHPTDLPTRLERALQVLLQHQPLSEIERRVGVYRGILGQMRPVALHPRRPSKHLVRFLEVLARHPEELDLIAD